MGESVSVGLELSRRQGRSRLSETIRYLTTALNGGNSFSADRGLALSSMRQTWQDGEQSKARLTVYH